MTTVAPQPVDSATTIRDAALAAFYELGYHGTSVRELAKRSGMSVAGMYHHFPSKQQLLVELVGAFMDDLLVDLEKAVAGAPADPVEQLRAAVRAHVLFHTRRQAEGFVGNAEVRSLEPEAQSLIVEKRNAEQRVFDRIIRDGVRAGVFRVQHEKLAGRGIVTMCTAVLSWFVPGAGMSAGQVADSYADLCLAMVRSPEPAPHGKGRR
ncbi:MAG TPA: TetR/AcrR family transcriptional regulator [Acidimicrobiia bacterium]|nr:TetR/AcrR family transcriptional regulator [Acidimicrobiia bacterium]